MAPEEVYYSAQGRVGLREIVDARLQSVKRLVPHFLLSLMVVQANVFEGA